MYETPDSFHRLLADIQAGSDAAVSKFLDLYGDHIYRAVRRRLNRALRPKFDSEDFVQAVWASFFRNRAQLSRFRQEGELIAFLAKVANNKVADECRRRLQTQKSNINRERSFDSGSAINTTLSGSDPTPSQVAMGNERWEKIVAELPSHYRRLVELRLAGETQEEIAKQLGVNEKTVRRVLRKLRGNLEQTS